jgi:hypothetical protein
MERSPSESGAEAIRAGPVLGIAGILTVVGGALFAFAIATAMDGSWGAAAIVSIMAVVAWVFAFNWLSFYMSWRSPEMRLHALRLKRTRALRRVDELRTYASFCELEANCWPEDSLDRAELVAYAEVARRLADESLREWREIERALRAERFEQITRGPTANTRN